jgi:hypothetical protein
MGWSAQRAQTANRALTARLAQERFSHGVTARPSQVIDSESVSRQWLGKWTSAYPNFGTPVNPCARSINRFKPCLGPHWPIETSSYYSPKRVRQCARIMCLCDDRSLRMHGATSGARLCTSAVPVARNALWNPQCEAQTTLGKIGVEAVGQRRGWPGLGKKKRHRLGRKHGGAQSESN